MRGGTTPCKSFLKRPHSQFLKKIQLPFNFIFNEKIIQCSRTFAMQVQTAWNQADAPFLLKSFPKTPHSQFLKKIQLPFNLIFSEKIIQCSRTFAMQVQMAWNQVDAPLLLKSFPKTPHSQFLKKIQLPFNLIFSEKFIQCSRTFVMQAQTAWNQADAPLLLKSFPKTPHSQFLRNF